MKQKFEKLKALKLHVGLIWFDLGWEPHVEQVEVSPPASKPAVVQNCFLLLNGHIALQRGRLPV